MKNTKPTSTVIVFILLCRIGYSQATENCSAINAFLKHKKSDDIFGLRFHQELPIILYDKKEIISQCSFSPIYGREVSVSRDSLDEQKISPSHFIVYNIRSQKKSLILFIRYKVTGADGRIIMKNRKRGIHIKDFDIGFF